MVGRKTNCAPVGSDYTGGRLYVHTQGSQVEIQTGSRWNLIGHSMTSPPFVIAQQYSSATLVPFLFHSCKEELGVHLKNVSFSF
jgi:hypothetical protein